MGSIPIGGALAAQAQSSLLQSREDHMIGQLNSLKGANENSKIEKSAQEFESMLLSTWLQQAEQSMGTIPGADEDDDSGGQRQQMMSLGVQSLSTALAASGGIGIGKMIAHALHAVADRQTAEENGVTKPAGAPAESKKIEK